MSIRNPVPDLAPRSDAKRRLLELLQRERPGISPESPVIPRRPAAMHAPLSYAQEQVWLHAQMAGELPIYNDPIAIHRRGVLDVRVLKRCVAEMVRRHEIWRTTFDTFNGQPVQIVRPPFESFCIPEFDLRPLSSSAKEAETRRLAAEDACRPFDLKSGPLLRAILVRLGDEEFRICMTFHQLVFDGVTAYCVVLPELATLYDAFSNQRSSTLPELPIQYADFAYWQRRTLAPATQGNDAAYWKRQLGGELPVLQWPADRPRPPVQSHRGAVDHFAFQEGLTSALKSFSREEGVSLYVTLLAGFAAVLHRYTQQTNIVLGVPSAGRKWPEVQALAGDFVNPLALRIDLAGNPSFRKLVARVREVVVNAVSHDEIPLQEVIKIVQPKLDASRNALFQIIFSLQPEMPRPYPGWDLRTEEVGNGGAKADLMVVVDSRPERIFGPITYNSDLFQASTIARMLGHWQTLLEGALAHPDCCLSDLPFLSDPERNQILVEWNDTAAACPANTCVHEMIEEQARKTPDGIALAFGRKELTYRELNDRASQFACYLRKLNLGSGNLVGVCIERSFDLLVAILGILKVGAAYVPLDPDLPGERLNFIARDAGLKVIVTTKALRAELEGLAEEFVSLDSDWSRELENGCIQRTPVHQDDVAYVIYTSGSTGQPKGVCIPHRALVNFLLSMQKYPGLTPDDVLVAVSAISFDISGLELYLPLVSGARCVLAPKDAVVDGQKLARLIDNSQATVMQATPTTWRLLLESGWQGRKGLKVLCGGEAMPQELARQLLPIVGSLWNMYGPTETTIWSTVQQITPDGGIVSIGRPIAKTLIYILDKRLQPLPIGASGDLYIGGEGLARGYHNRPDLTAERFLSNPFSDEPRARIYKTGDIARFRSNGEIVCLGRSDEQVKIRGFRIELGEIQHALAACSGVRQAAVEAREDVPGEKRLVAYVVSSLQTAPKPEELLTALRKKIPGYMLPSSIIFLESLPKLPNGKIDRRALPAPKFERATNGNGFKAPETATEKQLAMIWAAVLGVERIARDDNFFDLGGHSMSAVRLFTLIEKSFFVKLPLASLFQAPTLADLAKLLTDKDLATEGSCLVAMQPNGSRPPFFCVHGAGGNVLIYRDLARHLGTDQPFYGLQSRGFDGRSAYLTRIEDMATLYIDEIKKVQPQGPYHVGGYCMGGTVALEVARQFLLRGEKVALLALFDTLNWSNRPPDSMGQKLNRQIERLAFHLRNFLLLSFSERMTFLEEKFRVLRSRSRVWQGQLLGRLFKNRREIRSQSSILADIWEINHRAASNYVARPYPGVITDFRPMKQYSAFLRPEMEWDKLALGGHEVITLPVYPAGMLLEPFVKGLAVVLRTSIDKTTMQDKATRAASGAN